MVRPNQCTEAMADSGGESDDDAYFEMLADRAASNGVEDNSQERTAIDETKELPKSDEDYYNEQALTESGVFANEDESVWRVFLSAASSGGTANDGNLREVSKSSFADNMLLVDWLFSQLPRASSLFHLAKGVANASNGDFSSLKKEDLEMYHTFVDDIAYPSIVVMNRVKPGEVSCCVHTTRDVIDIKDARNIAKILKKLSIENGGRKICFMALAAEHLEVIVHVMEELGSKHKSTKEMPFKFKWKEPAALYSLHSSGQPEHRSKVDDALPEGYTVGPLEEEDASIVNDTWKYRSENSLSMVKGMIKKMPSAGVRDEKGDLCSWCCCYDGDCSIGMAFTLEDHRSKGLAKATARLVIARFIERKEGSSPYCYIVSGNEASVRVYRDALGFQKECDTFWAGFSGYA